MVREIAQEPYSDRTYQDDAAHLLQILLSLFPGVAEDRFCRRDAVWRKLHDERKVVILEETAHYLCCKYGKDYSKRIHSQQHKSCIPREEGSGDEYVDRHASGTGHQRNDEHRYQTALRAFDGPGGHYSRDVASEAHDHRYERLSVQADLVHQTVHYEGGPGHIS